jgi:type I site-specific restriction endonuclease
MPPEGPEAEARKRIDRLLDYAGWLPSEIREEENLQTGRLDYRLEDLCILEAKRPTAPNKEYVLKMHLQQAQRYGESAKHIPFLMVSDGELHFIQDTRNKRIERLLTIPSKEQLQTLKDDKEALREGDMILPPGLFDFQKKAVHEAVCQIYEGSNRLLLEMATGTGKTVIAAEIVNQMNRISWERNDRQISVLFLVDRDALEEQSTAKLERDVVKSLKVNTIDYVSEGGLVDVLVAQVATMQNRYNREPFNPNYFDLIIVDEAHRSVHGNVWRNVVEYFLCPQIGLTATPPRFKDDETVEYFGPPIFRYTYEDGVLNGILAPYIVHRVKTNIDRDGLAVGDELFESADFGVAVQVDNRDWAITRYYEEHFYGKKCLIFAAGTEHAGSLWNKFEQMFSTRGDGYRAQFVISSFESRAARMDIIKEFEEDDSSLKVLINLNILTAGFDYPTLDLLFMCRYTHFKSLYLQMKGRGSRLPLHRNGKPSILTDESGRPVKEHFTMADFVGVTEWENKDTPVRVPTAAKENLAESIVNIDPAQVRPQKIPSINVDVNIAEVEIINPFGGNENPMVRQLRSQLESVSSDLSTARSQLQRAQAARHEQEQAISALRRTVTNVQGKAAALQRDAFRQLVLSLQTFAPLAPLTEDVLRKVNPSLADINLLNEIFGANDWTLQDHIDRVLREAFVRNRYHELVERKHIIGLSVQEENEMKQLDQELDSIDESFYQPIIDNLDELLHKKRGEGN